MIFVDNIDICRTYDICRIAYDICRIAYDICNITLFGMYPCPWTA
jgi:hypothetical protein